MLNVFGLIVIPSEPQLKITETNKGAYLNFNVVSIDRKKDVHRYPANMFVPTDQIDEWKEKIVSGNIFLISGGKWSMKDNPDYKYPLPQLVLDRFHTEKLVNPWWMESGK